MLAEELRPIEVALASRYRFVRELGRGGWGVVCLAEDLPNSRVVAVKLLRIEMEFSPARDRFLREIDIVRHLDHPNIVPILDSGEAGGSLYYVMPFIEGGTLQQRLAHEQQLPVALALRIAREVALVLDHAHRAGIVHRDIKPANILLRNDTPLVADFGIARAIRLSGPPGWVSSSNLAIGTPHYMSPEQANADRLDGRTDVYSLGCVLYEMLAGVPPFTASTSAAIMSRHALDPVPPLQTVRPGISRVVERVVMRALAKVPADRFQTAREMADAIDAAAATGDKSIPPWTPGRITRRYGRIGIAIGALAVVAAGFTLAHRARTSGAEPSAYEIQIVQPATASGNGGSAATITAAGIESLRSWRDAHIRIITSAGSNELSQVAQSSAVSEDLGSRSIVTYDGRAIGDSVALTVRRVSFDGGRRVYDAQLRRTTTPDRAPELAARLTRRLFAPEGQVDSAYELSPGLTSLAAWREYNRGLGAVRGWDLREASIHLRRALASSDGFAPALLWSIQIDAIANPVADSASWVSKARQLERLSAFLSNRDSILATALAQMGRRDFSSALGSVGRLVAIDSTDPLAWIDRGIALSRDSVVLRDTRSPSGWRFRSSYSTAYAAFMRATRLDPRVVRVLPVSQLASLLIYRPATVRSGRAEPPDTMRFYALPSVVGDSVELIPVPSDEFIRGAIPPSVTEAVTIDQRQLTTDLAAWIHIDSTSADAFSILSELLEANGNVDGPGVTSSAAQALERALALEKTGARKLDLRAAKLRLLLKQTRFADVRREARRLLDDARRSGTTQPRWSEGVAALIGEREMAASLAFDASRLPRSYSRASGDPAALALAYSRFHAFANVGLCSAQTGQLLDSLLTTIDRLEAPNRRAATIERLLATDAGFAAPCVGARKAASIVGHAMPVHRMISALAQGDIRGLQHEVDLLRRDRSGARVTDITPDYALLEAWLVLQAGDTAAAVARLDSQVLSFTTLTPRLLNEASTAGSIGRAIVLRSSLATHNAAQRAHWAAAAEALLGVSYSLKGGFAP